MIKINKQLAFLSIIFLFLCCGKSYYVEYSVQNESNRVLLIDFIKNGASTINSNYLSPGYSLVFFIEEGSNSNVEDHVNRINELPVSFVKFEDQAGNQINCNIQKIECWHKWIYNKGNGDVNIRIRENSFE